MGIGSGVGADDIVVTTELADVDVSAIDDDGTGDGAGVVVETGVGVGAGVDARAFCTNASRTR